MCRSRYTHVSEVSDSVGAGEMIPWSRALPAHAEGQSLGPSTLARQLTTACIFLKHLYSSFPLMCPVSLFSLPLKFSSFQFLAGLLLSEASLGLANQFLRCPCFLCPSMAWCSPFLIGTTQPHKAKVKPGAKYQGIVPFRKRSGRWPASCSR